MAVWWMQWRAGSENLRNAANGAATNHVLVVVWGGGMQKGTQPTDLRRTQWMGKCYLLVWLVKWWLYITSLKKVVAVKWMPKRAASEGWRNAVRTAVGNTELVVVWRLQEATVSSKGKEAKDLVRTQWVVGFFMVVWLDHRWLYNQTDKIIGGCCLMDENRAVS